jgi:hypothetical protein
MTWLAPILKHRVQIRKSVQTPSDDGGAVQSYETITTLWAACSNTSDYIKAIRGANGEDIDSHKFKVRTSGIMSLGKAFSSGYSEGYKGIDIYSLKADYFLFDQAGSVVRGRLFKISRVKLDEDNSEYMELMTREIEEVGSGYPQ